MAAQSHRPGPITARLTRLMRVALVATTAFALAGGRSLASRRPRASRRRSGSIRALRRRHPRPGAARPRPGRRARSSASCPTGSSRMPPRASTWTGSRRSPGSGSRRDPAVASSASRATGVVPLGYRGWTRSSLEGAHGRCPGEGRARRAHRGADVVGQQEPEPGPSSCWASRPPAPGSSTRSLTEVMATGADGVNLDFEPMPAEVRDDFTLLRPRAAERPRRGPAGPPADVRYHGQRRHLRHRGADRR